jgi:hypothetical protein
MLVKSFSKADVAEADGSAFTISAMPRIPIILN